VNLDQLRAYVVRPVLAYLEPQIPYTPGAENLILGTGLVESKYEFVRQVGRGPARSVWQIEPFTEADLHVWLKRYPELAAKIDRLMWPEPSLDNLTANLAYGAAMCRVFYRRLPDAIPGPQDAQGMAELWKRRYNTALGAGTVEKALPHFRSVCP
jgi:hypothetical protein